MKSLKLILAIFSFALVAHTAMAAFTTDKNDDNKNKYSLKHLNKLSNNYLSFQSKFRTTQSRNYFYSREANGLSVSAPTNSFLSSQKNTTYVYPYKYVVKVPKFKTPSRPE